MTRACALVDTQLNTISDVEERMHAYSHTHGRQDKNHRVAISHHYSDLSMSHLKGHCMHERTYFLCEHKHHNANNRMLIIVNRKPTHGAGDSRGKANVRRATEDIVALLVLVTNASNQAH